MKEIYQLLSGAMNQELRMSQIANNLANLNTPGFKRDDASFQNVLKTAMGGQSTPASDTGTANPADMGWTSLMEAHTDFRQGDLRPTGNKLDLAIDGAGFFMVQGDDKEVYYTRAGNMKINERGELVTVSGRKVLDPNQQPITFDLNQGQPKFMPDGTILVGNATVGRIGMVRFDDTRKLEKYGEGALFRALGGLAPQPVTEPVLRQEMLESANVSAVDEMVRMIQTQRSYQMQEKVIQTVDELASRRLDVARS